MDENIAGIKITLENINSVFNVETVQSEKIRRIPDKDLIKLLLVEERILITTDRDFENLLMYPPGKHCGIVILRTQSQGKSNLSKLVIDLFDELTNRGYDPNNLTKDRIVVQRKEVTEVLIESLEWIHTKRNVNDLSLARIYLYLKIDIFNERNGLER